MEKKSLFQKTYWSSCLLLQPFISLSVCIVFLYSMPASSSENDVVLKAISKNDLNQILKYENKHPWLKSYLTKLLNTDLDFAKDIEDNEQKLHLLNRISEKTKFTPTKIQILNIISDLELKLKKSNAKTKSLIKELTEPLIDPKDCVGFLRKGKIFRDLRDFDQSFFHFQASFDCFENPESQLNSLKEITLTHKVKFRGTDFLNASNETFLFAKEAFLKNKIDAKLLNKVGIEHSRAVWTYKSSAAAEEILNELKVLLNGKFSLQTVYWIQARIHEENNDIKDSQKFLNLALKEKPIVEDDLVAIYWQKFWNHNELNQIKEAEDSLNASLQIGNPNEGQSRTYYWLIETLNKKVKSDLAKIEKFKKLKSEKRKIEDLNEKIEATKKEIAEYQKILTDKYPISFYSALLKKNAQTFYAKSDLEDLNSNSYKPLPKGFDFKFYKQLHVTSTLATQSFLNYYYSRNKRKISKEQRFLIKRMMARNGDTTDLFIEIEHRPEICSLETSPCMDLFPRPYEEVTLKASEKYNIPQDLIYSIIRQESIFNPLAKSWADARGLMQLLPNIAKEISKGADVEYKSPLDLYSVEKNIFFGTYLIKSLIKEMNGSLILGLSGYNAEKSKAKTWYKTRFKKDWFKFIEEIPYQETRNYNKLVLRNFLIYSNNNEKVLKDWFPKNM